MKTVYGLWASVFLMSFFIGMIFFSGVSPALASQIIYHSGEARISANTTWHQGEIHVINDYSSLTIDPGVTLTLEPGTIVKMGHNTLINVYGNFSALGTEADLIYIVSLKDDSVGGDTNNDGSATTAGIGDWRGILPNGYRYGAPISLNLEYVVIKSGGGTQAGGGKVLKGALILAQNIVDLKINHCDISDNKGGIIVHSFAGSAMINNSNLYNPSFCNYASSTDVCHYDAGVSVYTSRAVNLTNNFWGNADGPTYTTSTEPRVFAGVVLADIGRGGSNYLPFAIEPFEFGKHRIDPVILLPGILGSWNVLGKLELDPILHTYDNLWEAFKLSGYVEGEDLFAFPYEWRDSNVLNALRLKEKIAEVKAICDCDKVDVVAHSMGGIVARAYVQGPNYVDDIDQLIFLATPQRGSPASYLTWEGGEVGTKNTDKLLKMVFDLEAKSNGYKNIFDYVQNRPVFSVGELLPIFDYLKDSDSGIIRNYPDGYPRNNLLETLSSVVSLARLAKVKVYNFVANNGLSNTIDNLRVVEKRGKNGEWPDGYPENFSSLFGDHGLEYGAGDGTVPTRSNRDFLNLTDYNYDSDHGQIVTDAQKQVIKLLRGAEPELEVRKNLAEKLLLVRIFSPADFQIIAPDGKIVGKDFGSNSVINQIDGAYYSGFSAGPEFVTIPNPVAGDYRIKLVGTEAGGAYLISNTIINSSGESVQADYSGQILAGQNRELNFSYSTGFELSVVKADITIESAIKTIGELYDRQLLLDVNKKKKIIQQYELIRLKVGVVDKLIELAQVANDKLVANKHLKSEVKDKLMGLVDAELEKLKARRSEEIVEGLQELDEKYLSKYLSVNSLKQLGYDIIKSNNDYLINNW